MYFIFCTPKSNVLKILTNSYDICDMHLTAKSVVYVVYLLAESGLLSNVFDIVVLSRHIQMGAFI